MLAPANDTAGDYAMNRELFVQMARLGAHAIRAVQLRAPSTQPHSIRPAEMAAPDVAALLGQTYACCVMILAEEPDAPDDVAIAVPWFRLRVEAALHRSHVAWLADGAPIRPDWTPHEEAERLADLIPDLLAQDDDQ